MNELYLVHHGIKEQKWGSRNGPPYPLEPSMHSAAEKKAEAKANYRIQKITNGDVEGAKREYKKAKAEAKQEKKINRINEKAKREKELAKRSTVKEMSDEELKSEINRLQKEKQYKELTGYQKSRGSNFVENIAIMAGTTLVTVAVSKLAGAGAQAIVNKVSDLPISAIDKMSEAAMRRQLRVP